jgi:PAS domain S-box-containing protein
MYQENNQTINSIATLNDINAIVLVSNQSGKIIFVNQATKEILGYEPEELLGDGWWNLTQSKLDTETRKSITVSLAKGELNINERHLFENVLKAKDGSVVWTQWTNTINQHGNLVGIAQDITQKKALEQELIRKNEENKLLLKEIHHRVKNNLQIISSMLNIQFNAIDDPRVREALAKSKDRIHSMALIHEKIYTSKSLASINFDDYLYELVNSIKKGYDYENKIELELNKSKAIFDIDLAINLGIIITELLTNAYKHAFTNNPNKKRGKIILELKILSAKSHQLTIKDNGKGLGLKVLKSSHYNYGLEIVDALIEQINGTLETKSKDGLTYIMRFEA